MIKNNITKVYYNNLPGLFCQGLFILVFLLIVFSPTVRAADTKAEDLPKEAVKALYLGQQALQEKNYKETIRVLTGYMAQATKPIPLPAFQMLGYAWYELGNPEQTREVYEKAHQTFPNNPEMLQNYTILTYETGRLNEAAKLFEKLYVLKGRSEKKLLYQASGIYYQAENLKEAKRILTQLLTLKGKPESRWYEDIIAICIELEEWRQAEKWAKIFLKIKPGQARYWRLLAQMRLDREEYRSAASALEIAYRLEGGKNNEWVELADLYMYLNAPLMAARCLKAGYGKDIPYEQKIKIAQIYARTQRFDKGVAYLDAAIKTKPSAQLLFDKGRMLYDAMAYEKAISALEACTKMDPKFGQAYILAGFAAWNMNNFQKARSAFARASTLPEQREQANDAVLVLDDLMAAMSEKTN